MDTKKGGLRMFFDRVNYKERGKEIVKANFWILVLASFVANLLGGQSSFNSGGGGSASTGTSNFDTETFYDAETGKLNEEIVVAFMAIFTTVLIVTSVILVFSIVYTIFVGNMMQVGKKKLFLENVYEPNTDFALVFSGFTGGKYMQRVKTMFFYRLRITLWTLLFIIPGIIAQYKYYLVPYIVADNPDIDTKRALELSKEMTEGHKFDIFVMELSFLGWSLLAGCTCGILGFWLNPYMESSFAVMYTEMKNYAITNGIATADEFGMYGVEVVGETNTYNNDYNQF